MKTNKKAKWIVGTVGVAFSAFVLSQFTPTQTTSSNQVTAQVQVQQQGQKSTTRTTQSTAQAKKTSTTTSQSSINAANSSSSQFVFSSKKERKVYEN